MKVILISFILLSTVTLCKSQVYLATDLGYGFVEQNREYYSGADVIPARIALGYVFAEPFLIELGYSNTIVDETYSYKNKLNSETQFTEGFNYSQFSLMVGFDFVFLTDFGIGIKGGIGSTSLSADSPFEYHNQTFHVYLWELSMGGFVTDEIGISSFYRGQVGTIAYSPKDVTSGINTIGIKLYYYFD